MPLFGARRRATLEENAAAASIGVPETIIDRLTEAFTPAAVSGERYPEYAAAWLDHGTPTLSE